MILTKDESEIITYLLTNTETDFIFLPDELTTIRPYAFYGNTYLKSIIIPINTINIGDYAFSHCSNLVNVFYLGYIKPKVGNDIFTGTLIKTINIKNDSKIIPFDGYGINIRSPSQTENIFYFYDIDTGILIIYGNGSMSNSYFISSVPNSISPWLGYRSGLKYIFIENGVTNIGESAFYYFSSSNQGFPKIKSIKIGKSVTKIGYRAFWSCSSLTTVVIKSNILTFGEEVFWGCNKLQSFYFYGSTQPLYSSRVACWDGVFGCGTDSSRVICTPFYCAVNSLKTVYVHTNYTGNENNFCGKSVTISKTLELEYT